jgi:hypothetical protein
MQLGENMKKIILSLTIMLVVMSCKDNTGPIVSRYATLVYQSDYYDTTGTLDYSLKRDNIKVYDNLTIDYDSVLIDYNPSVVFYGAVPFGYAIQDESVTIILDDVPYSNIISNADGSRYVECYTNISTIGLESK